MRDAANGAARYVVITGGRHVGTYVQILDLQTMSWRDGPRLPEAWMYAAVVPYRRTFLIVGGYSRSGYRNTIIEFDADHLSWIVLCGRRG